jgi:hypothetical protein
VSARISVPERERGQRRAFWSDPTHLLGTDTTLVCLAAGVVVEASPS